MALHMNESGFFGVMIHNNCDYTEHQLREELARFGKLEELKMISGRNLVFLQFKEYHDARACLDQLQEDPDYYAKPARPREARGRDERRSRSVGRTGGGAEESVRRAKSTSRIRSLGENHREHLTLANTSQHHTQNRRELDTQNTTLHHSHDTGEVKTQSPRELYTQNSMEHHMQDTRELHTQSPRGNYYMQNSREGNCVGKEMEEEERRLPQEEHQRYTPPTRRELDLHRLPRQYRRRGLGAPSPTELDQPKQYLPPTCKNLQYGKEYVSDMVGYQSEDALLLKPNRQHRSLHLERDEDYSVERSGVRFILPTRHGKGTRGEEELSNEENVGYLVQVQDLRVYDAICETGLRPMTEVVLANLPLWYMMGDVFKLCNQYLDVLHIDMVYSHNPIYLPYAVVYVASGVHGVHLAKHLDGILLSDKKLICKILEDIITLA